MPESFLIKLQACSFIKKETLAQVFSCEFCEISKNIFFVEHLQETVSTGEKPEGEHDESELSSFTLRLINCYL